MKKFILWIIVAAILAMIPVAFFISIDKKTVAFDHLLNVIEVLKENYIASLPDPEPMDILTISQEISLPSEVRLNVPFTSQAPFANWNMPYQEACEEASMIMVRYFLRGESLSPEKADEEILAITNWQDMNSYKIDTDARETGEMAEKFYDLEWAVYYEDQVTAENIRHLLAAGHPVIIPAAGQLLGNPNFTPPGPAYHMLVITGYDEFGNFVTNDPGTRFGQSYSYSEKTLMTAIHDWIGAKETIQQGPRAMLILYNE